MAFIENKIGDLIFMSAPNIPVPHAFTTRFGGVSKGVYRSLNLGENRGDDEKAVARNFEIMCSALSMPVKRLVFSKQVHENTVRLAVKDDSHAFFTPVPYEADPLVTGEKELPLVIFTADCIPILLYDPVCCAIGAVHAGWRGTVMDIAGAAVRKMESHLGCSPQNIRAAVGPGISRCCFETGEEVPAAVHRLLGDEAAEFISEKGLRFMVDLKGLNRRLMEKAGVLSEHIEVSDECTVCKSEKYWSHRVTKGERGSQASMIMLKGNHVS